MYIELISKSTKWEGERGVLMSIRAAFYPRDYNGMSAQDALNTKNARSLVDIQISGLGEVSIGWVDKCGTPSDTYVEEVHQWLDDKGLLSEWREETSKYIRALSRVELPIAPEYVVRGGYLLYYLKMRYYGPILTLENAVAITVNVTVYEDRAAVFINLRAGDDKYDEDADSIELGRSTITGPVTTDTLKAEVSKSLDRLWDLLQQPMVAD